MLRNRRLVVLLSVTFAVSAVLVGTSRAQSTATIQGTVFDKSGAVVPGANVVATNQATSQERATKTDNSGQYLIPSLQVGSYRVKVSAQGMQPVEVTGLTLQVAQNLKQDFNLKIATSNEVLEITGEAPVIESTTMTVGQVIDQKTVQDIPLNGRHFVDLGLLIPGSVTPPQAGFLTFPIKGQGSLAFNTAGNREDAVNFMVNGVNLNDMVQNQVTFQPTISTVQEFKVDNSTYSAESGRSSGAIVNIATRSGSNAFHGEAFEYLRNNYFDARNFFNPVGIRQTQFQRNQYGGNIGGPIWKNKTFFFFSFEGLRQHQGSDTNSIVLTDPQRAAALAGGNPAIAALLKFIPEPNSVDATGASRFLGSAGTPVKIDQYTGDVSHNFSENDRLNGYYAFQHDVRQERGAVGGSNIPGFGDNREGRRQLLTLNESHVFGPSWVNEARLGFNRIHITFGPINTTDVTTLGIGTGVSPPLAVPRIRLSAIGLTFGGPSGEPQGRGDTTSVLSDSVSYLRGNHSIKFGGEFRNFRNGNFSGDPGTITFNTLAAFNQGLVSSFTRNPGGVNSRITENALGFFAMDDYKIRPYFNLELGLRWDWNMTPTEARNRFVVFDPTTDSLLQTGNGLGDIYRQNRSFAPRVGFAWDLLHNGKFVLRSGYGYAVDEPITGLFIGLTANPPLSNPISFVAAKGSLGIPIATVAASALGASGVSPVSIDRNFRNANTQSWNLNLQTQVTPTLGMMVGYFGSKGTHLEIDPNINQPINGVKPFTTLSLISPIKPGAVLGSITQRTSDSTSSYNALWVSGTKRLSHGLQVNGSYTWAHSIDNNSLNDEGTLLQNSYNIRGDRGNSDFDVRHRLELDSIYELPFKGNRAVSGWQVATIIQLQSGNPVNIYAANSFSSLNGVVNPLTGGTTVRPDLIGPIATMGSVSQWFSTATCNPVVTNPCPAGSVFAQPISPGGVAHFGDLGRTPLVGPDFKNLDFSVMKNTKITEKLNVQLRADAFDLFNHPNFGQPGEIAGTSNFGTISSTRFPTGDSGSSRQLQFAMKLIF